MSNDIAKLPKWVDITIHDKHKNDDKSKVLELKLPSDLRITIVRGHVFYPENWVMHCFALAIDTRPLEGIDMDDIDGAKKTALVIVNKKITKWYNELKTIT